MKSWQLQQAKAHLSELVQKASAGKPQEITLRGKPAVVVLSVEQFEQLQKPKPGLVDFLQSSPLANQDIDFSRDMSDMRDIDL